MSESRIRNFVNNLRVARLQREQADQHPDRDVIRGLFDIITTLQNERDAAQRVARVLWKAVATQELIRGYTHLPDDFEPPDWLRASDG